MPFHFPQTYSAPADETAHSQLDNIIEEEDYRQSPNEYSISSSLQHRQTEEAIMDLVMGLTGGGPVGAAKTVGKKAGKEVINTIKSLLGIGQKASSAGKVGFPTALQKQRWAGKGDVRLFSGNRKWKPGEMVKDRKYVGKGKVTESRLTAEIQGHGTGFSGSWSSLTNKDILKSMKDNKWYYDKWGQKVSEGSKNWYKSDWNAAVAKQAKYIKSIGEKAHLYRETGRHAGNIFEFKVPRGWIEEFSLQSGIPIEFLKKIHW